MLGQLKSQQRELDRLLAEQQLQRRQLDGCNRRWRCSFRDALSSPATLLAAAATGFAFERLTNKRTEKEPERRQRPEQPREPTATQVALRTLMRAVLSAAVAQTIKGFQNQDTDSG